MFPTTVNTLRPLLALFLLAVWAGGAIVLPVAHDVVHSGEQAERAERIAETHGDHHHHGADSPHGTEAQPYCPETTDMDLVCAVCSTPAAAMLASSVAAFDALSSRHRSANVDVRADADETTQLARGPPAA